MGILGLINKLRMTGSHIIGHNEFGIVTKGKDSGYEIYLLCNKGTQRLVHENSRVRINEHFIVVLDGDIGVIAAVYVKGAPENKVESSGLNYNEAVTDVDIFSGTQGDFIQSNYKLMMVVGGNSLRLISYNGKVKDLIILTDGRLVLEYNVCENLHTIIDIKSWGADRYANRFNDELDEED